MPRRPVRVLFAASASKARQRITSALQQLHQVAAAAAADSAAVSGTEENYSLRREEVAASSKMPLFVYSSELEEHPELAHR